MIPISEEAYLAKDNLFRLNLAKCLIGDCTFASIICTEERNEIFRSIEEFIGRLPELTVTMDDAGPRPPASASES